ncbi:MAG: hypothetical protein Q8K65_01420 [Alphaproteobacteria bacterium]|nr:hypothetical protein [Alphaproteobacteria bacterium]
MFGKPQHIEGLPPEDQSWAQGIGGFGGWKKALSEAVVENKAQRVRYLMKKHQPKREMRFQLASRAVDAKAGAALAEVLAQRGFDFADGTHGDIAGIHMLLKHALKQKDVEVWRVLCERNAREPHAKIDNDDVVRMAAKARWYDGLAWNLDHATAKNTEVFNVAMHMMRDGTAQDLSFVLSWTAKFSGHGPALNAALKTVAEEGAVDKLALLLDKGADPNHDVAAAMYQALAFGHRAVFDLLVERGGKLDVYGPDLLARLRQQNPQSTLMAHLESLVGDKLEAAEARRAQSRLGQRYHLTAPDTFSETLHLPEGRTLTTVFNFSTRQQTTIAERVQGEAATPVMAVHVRDFDDIADLAVIENAEHRLVQLGGAVPVVARQLQKSPGALKPAAG